MANTKSNEVIIVKKQVNEGIRTNTYEKVEVKSADYELISNKIASIEAKRNLDVKLKGYALFMKNKKPFKEVLHMDRIKSSGLTGKPIPGRILTDYDVKQLCKGNEEKITEILYELIAASMGYAPAADKKATIEDAEALLKYLMQHGTPEVQAEAKVIMATFITQTVDRQEEALSLFDEAINEMKKANMDEKDIIAAEADRVLVYIFMDDPEGMESAADKFYETYKENNSQEYFWEKMMELYWIRATTFLRLDNEYAKDICMEAISIDNEHAKRSCEKWKIKKFYENIEKGNLNH